MTCEQQQATHDWSGRPVMPDIHLVPQKITWDWLDREEYPPHASLYVR